MTSDPKFTGAELSVLADMFEAVRTHDEDSLQVGLARATLDGGIVAVIVRSMIDEDDEPAVVPLAVVVTDDLLDRLEPDDEADIVWPKIEEQTTNTGG